MLVLDMQTAKPEWGDALELPKRKNIRLKDYDYSSNGAYFITICTQNRLHLFGNVVGDEFPVPFVELNGFGKIIEQYIQNISDKYPVVTVDKYIIMPNHVHMLIMIFNDGTMGNNRTGNPSPTAVGTIVGWFKYQTTKAINAHTNNAETKIWQRSYHDHIIRNGEDYLRIWQYIDENPAKWAEDEYY